jgi:hypothetical protein
MKKAILFVVALLAGFPLFAQLSFGIKGGLATTQVDVSALSISDPGFGSDLVFQLENANYGLHGGIFLQAKIGSFLIQPEATFNSSSADFRVTQIMSGETVEAIFRETYQHLDIPIMMGFQLGPVRLMGGPVGHLFLQTDSKMEAIEGYKPNFDQLTYGWQAGVGIDIWKIMFDFRYEGNFDKYGSHFSVAGEPYSFDRTPARIIASIGFKF